MTDRDQPDCNAQAAATAEDLDDEAAQFSTLTEEQTREREKIVQAIGQRVNALMRYDAKDPALTASALLWCAISMYAQGAPDLTKDGMLLVCGSTWDEAKRYLEQLAQESPAAKDRRKLLENVQALQEGLEEGLKKGGSDDGKNEDE